MGVSQGVKIDDSIIDRLKSGRERLLLNDNLFSERYLRNIKVIENYFPSIFKEIKNYKPKNKNIFVEKDGALNLFFKETGYTLFSEDPFKQIDNKYNQFRNKPSRTVINVESNLSDRSRHEYYLSRAHQIKKDKKKTLTQYKELPDFIGGVVLFGFDLGYQLVRMLDEHFINHIYIYEENIDLFYYSLFAIDWEWVVAEMESRDCTLHFFLGLDEKQFVSQYMSDLRYNGLYLAPQTFLYMGYSREHIETVLDEFHNQYVRQVMGWGFFDDGVIGIGQYLSRRKSPTSLAVIPDYETKPGFNKNLNLPVMILGNGPSLDTNIDFVKENSENAIIISCGTTLNTLAKYGIKPDYHADVERLKHTAEKLAYLDPKFLSGITALTVNVMHPDFYEYFDRSIIGLKPSEPISSIMQKSALISEENRKKLLTMNFSGPIVANLAMSYATQMGFSEVYLIGVDCGFKDPEEHHSKASGYYNKDGSNTGLVEFNRNLVKRKANFGGYAYTTAIMDTSRVQLELAISYTKSKNKMFRCYNLSDGVKINGADPLLAEDVLMASQSQGKKQSTKDYIWKHFVSEELDSYDSRDIGDVHQHFTDLSKQCAEILVEPFEDKKELLKLFARFNEVLMKHYFNNKVYAAELMKGSFVYFVNEVMDMVLSSPEDSLDTAREMISLFSVFIDEMPSMLVDPRESVDKGRGLLDGKYNG